MTLFAWMDNPAPYTDLPIELDEYNDFIKIHVDHIIQPAVLASMESKNLCLQLQHLSNSHLIRAIASNLSRTTDINEACYWLQIVSKCFTTDSGRYGRLMVELAEMARRAPPDSSTVSGVQTFLQAWHAVEFKPTRELGIAAVEYSTQKPTFTHLYTVS